MLPSAISRSKISVTPASGESIYLAQAYGLNQLDDPILPWGNGLTQAQQLDVLLDMVNALDPAWDTNLQQFIIGDFMLAASTLGTGTGNLDVTPDDANLTLDTAMWNSNGKLVAKIGTSVEHLSYSGAPTTGTGIMKFNINARGQNGTSPLNIGVGTLLWSQVYDVESHSDMLVAITRLAKYGRATATMLTRAQSIANKLSSARPWNATTRDWERWYDAANSTGIAYHAASSHWVREALLIALENATALGLSNAVQTNIRSVLALNVRNLADYEIAHEQEAGWYCQTAYLCQKLGITGAGWIGKIKRHLDRTFNWESYKSHFHPDGMVRYGSNKGVGDNPSNTTLTRKAERGDTELRMHSSTPWSEYPNSGKVLLGYGSNCQIVSYTGKDSGNNKLTGVTGISSIFPVGSIVTVAGEVTDTTNINAFAQPYYQALCYDGLRYLTESLQLDPSMVDETLRKRLRWIGASLLGNWVGARPFYSDTAYRNWQTVAAHPLGLLTIIRNPILHFDRNAAVLARTGIERWIETLTAFDETLVTLISGTWYYDAADNLMPTGFEMFNRANGFQESKRHHHTARCRVLSDLIDDPATQNIKPTKVDYVKVRLDWNAQRIVITSPQYTAGHLFKTFATSPLIPKFVGPARCFYGDKYGRLLGTNTSQGGASGGFEWDNTYSGRLVTGGNTYYPNGTRSNGNCDPTEWTLLDADGLVVSGSLPSDFDTTIRSQLAAYVEVWSKRPWAKEVGQGGQDLANVDHYVYCRYYPSFSEIEYRERATGDIANTELRYTIPIAGEAEIKLVIDGSTTYDYTNVNGNKYNNSDTYVAERYHHIRRKDGSGSFVSGYILMHAAGNNGTGSKTPANSWYLQVTTPGSDSPIVTKALTMRLNSTTGTLKAGDNENYARFFEIPTDTTDASADEAWQFGTNWLTNEAAAPAYSMWFASGRHWTGSRDNQTVKQFGYYAWAFAPASGSVQIWHLEANKIQVTPSATNDVTIKALGVSGSVTFTVTVKSTGAIVTTSTVTGNTDGEAALTVSLTSGTDYYVQVVR